MNGERLEGERWDNYLVDDRIEEVMKKLDDISGFEGYADLIAEEQRWIESERERRQAIITKPAR